MLLLLKIISILFSRKLYLDRKLVRNTPFVILTMIEKTLYTIHAGHPTSIPCAQYRKLIVVSKNLGSKANCTLLTRSRIRTLEKINWYNLWDSFETKLKEMVNLTILIKPQIDYSRFSAGVINFRYY